MDRGGKRTDGISRRNGKKDSGSSKICEYSNYLKYRYLPLKYRIGVYAWRSFYAILSYLAFIYRSFIVYSLLHDCFSDAR